MSTQFGTTYQPDSPLVQNAAYRLNGADRQDIDQQVRDLQTVAATYLVNGAIATSLRVDSGSAELAKGDAFCRSTASTLTVTKATPAALAAANGVFGVALAAAAPGARVIGAIAGAIDPSITGLATGAAGFCRVSSAARPEQVVALSSGDYALGTIDSAGWLVLAMQVGAAGGGGSFAKNLSAQVLLTESLTTGISQPLSIADATFTGKVAGGSVASTGTVGVVAGSFASSAAETSTGSAQAGLGAAAAADRPYNVTDFPGQRGVRVELRKQDGDDVQLQDVLAAATGADTCAKVYGYLSYRSDLGANLKWRLWFYYRRNADGFETPVTPDISLSNAKLYIPEVFAIADLPVAAGLGLLIAGQSAADGTDTPTAKKLPVYGTAGVLKATQFISGSGTPAGIGLLAAANNTTIIGFKDSGGNDGIGMSISSANLLALGDTARVENTTIGVKTAGTAKVTVGSTDTLTTNESGTAFGGSPHFGGGVGVISIQAATTAPTSETGGVPILYGEPTSGVLKVRSGKACVTTLAPTLANTSTGVFFDFKAEKVQTTDAVTVTNTITFSLPASCVGTIVLLVTALKETGTTGGWFERRLQVRRPSAGDAVVSHSDTVGTDRDSLGGIAGIATAISGGDVTVTVAGVAATTIDWLVSGRLQLLVP